MWNSRACVIELYFFPKSKILTILENTLSSELLQNSNFYDFSKIANGSLSSKWVRNENSSDY